MRSGIIRRYLLHIEIGLMDVKTELFQEQKKLNSRSCITIHKAILQNKILFI